MNNDELVEHLMILKANHQTLFNEYAYLQQQEGVSIRLRSFGLHIYELASHESAAIEALHSALTSFGIEEQHLL